MPGRELFRRFCKVTAYAVGTPLSFGLAILVVVAWMLSGPFFHFSDTWQLVINTGTTIVTFIMVFLIQNSQNRDTREIQLKLDELLRGVHGARTELVGLEDMSDEELEHLQEQFKHLRERIVLRIAKRKAKDEQAGEGQ